MEVTGGRKGVKRAPLWGQVVTGGRLLLEVG